jgi:hypothetical protein
MAEVCELQVATDLSKIDVCDARNTSFIERTSLIQVPNSPLQLAPTIRYRIAITPLGLAVGKHLYSTTLVPGETVELEVFRSTKVTDELSQQFSVEETFSQELSSTVQNEWSKKQDSNFKIGGGVSASLDLGIFSIGAHAEPEYSTQEETFQKTVSEFVAKTSAKVDRKHDIHMDTKTETVESTRSTRTLRNFNQCQPVTYNYFQLARKLRVEMIVDALTFDIVRERPHPLLTTRFDALFNVPRFVPPKPQTILGELVPSPTDGPTPQLAGAVGSVAPPVAVIAQATVQHPVLAPDFDRPVRQLTADQLALVQLTDAERGPINDIVKRLTQQFPVGKVVSQQEFCVNTPGTLVESITGHCLACDTHTALIQQTERDKLRLELLKAEQEQTADATATGFVLSMARPVQGATVRLRRQRDNTVLGETVTDSDGRYALFARGLVRPLDDLTVDVPQLPPGFTSVTPTAITFSAGEDQPVRVDFVASA